VSSSAGNLATDDVAASILLVDDDVELCELMLAYFESRGLRLEMAHDGRVGLARSLAGGHDLILLDVMMPGLDGFGVLRLLRRQSQTPVIMLTARTSLDDRVAGLDAGADDYLPKPFGPEELLARIRAVLRRSRQVPPKPEVIEHGPLRLVTAARQATCDGASLGLTTIEYDLLEYLARAAGRTVTRDELNSALYRRPVSPFDRAIDVHVSNLRKKLGPRGALLQTVRGVGFLVRVGSSSNEEPC
jgi:two-component system response regulator CpxR